MPWLRLSIPKASAAGTKAPYPMVLTTEEAPARMAEGMASCRERVSAMFRTVTPKIVATWAATTTRGSWANRPKAVTSVPSGGYQHRAAAAQPVGERAAAPGAAVHQRAGGAVPEHRQCQAEVPQLVELDQQAHDHAVGHQRGHDPAGVAPRRAAHDLAQMGAQVRPGRRAVQAGLAEPGQGEERAAGERDRQEVLGPQAGVAGDHRGGQRTGDERRGLEHLHPAVAALEGPRRTGLLEHHVVDGRIVGPRIRRVEQPPDRDPGGVQGQAMAEPTHHRTADQRTRGEVKHALAAPPVSKQRPAGCSPSSSPRCTPAWRP